MTETAGDPTPTGFFCAVPSRLGVGEPFALKLRVQGDVREVASWGQWNTVKPGLRSPFNFSPSRNIRYLDNTLPKWRGRVTVDGGPALAGPACVEFLGQDQGAFPGDERPIAKFEGFHWTQPGFHFIRLVDEATGVEGWANPVYVTTEAPQNRLFWGDPHWQTYFSDGLRCPEELYAFARDEAFLDFGAITDHMEAVTDRQWDYFVAVTNDFDQPRRFATLVGQEWTKHHPGHRNVYFRGPAGPVLRSTDPAYDSLEKLWRALDGHEALAIPHHSANVTMGCDWSFGWNERYEKAVEIYSVWGSSECPAGEGNSRPILSLGGEKAGRHVLDALRRGFRFGFVGGGDIHDGRPGDCLDHRQPNLARAEQLYPSGLTAVWAPVLRRESVFDALRDRQTYATTLSRIYLETELDRGAGGSPGRRLRVRAASEEGIHEAVLIRAAGPAGTLRPGPDPRILEAEADVGEIVTRDFIYVRIVTEKGNLAWSSPIWGA